MLTASRAPVGARSTIGPPDARPHALAHPPSPTSRAPAGGRILRAAPWLRRDPWRRATLVAIRIVHSAVFFAEEASVGYLLYAGMRKRQGRAAAVAAGAIAAESLIYFANGQHCPLSRLAEELGADHVSVTDIYLPRWIAMRIFTYNAPLVALAALLHARIVLSGHVPNGARAL